MHRSIRRWCLALCLGPILAGLTLAAQPAWFDAAGHARPEAKQAVSLLRAADTHGLDPSDYGAEHLAEALGKAGQPAHDVSRLDQALTEAMLRYLRHLRHGRVDPRQVGGGFRPSRQGGLDAQAVLQEALAVGDLDQAVQRSVPPLAQYELLRQALQHYRTLKGHPAWQQALPALPARATGGARRLEPGSRYAGLHLLARRLEALGDLPPRTASRYQGHDALYDDDLLQAVRRFQQRHGLTVDGVPGRQTLAQLAVTPDERVVQIGLALERLRWTPLLHSPRMVVVNIPEFVLRGYEQTDRGIRVGTEMRVIVGQAARHATPLFDEDMRFIEFSPYWNVPRSIAADETVPRLLDDPGHLDRMGFEIIGRDGSIHRLVNDELLADVLAGRALLRQRPGPENALGGIKFVFPNREHIFLHDTPAVSLFQRDRRDFSHGCIRVEDPLALARFVMQEMPAWTEARIVEAMGRGESQTVRLSPPVPVVIAYITALVKDGQVHFFDDIYGHDRLLQAALKACEAGVRGDTRPAGQR